MKNRFFAALLTLAIIPFFTATANNTELATHLTQIKVELETAKTEVVSMITKIAETAGQNYRETESATSELYNLMADSISSDIDKVFNALCTQIKPLQEIEIADNSIEGAFEHLFKDNFIQMHQQEIEAILNKYSKNRPSQDKDASTLEARVVSYFFTSPESLMIVTMVVARETCTTLLQKVDAKLAELKRQQ